MTLIIISLFLVSFYGTSLHQDKGDSEVIEICMRKKNCEQAIIIETFSAVHVSVLRGGVKEPGRRHCTKFV